jgi:Predicted dehydrogenases and related proteins
MKVLFCGLGSIGSRHLRNLVTAAGEAGIRLDVHALRKTEKELARDAESAVSLQIYEESRLHTDYDIAFVANPTSLHFDTIRMLADKAGSLFIEKPIFEKGEYKISDLGLSNAGTYYVAGPLRYSPVIRELRKFIPMEEVYSVRVICSSYLPDWRPSADYRFSYSARREMGGGVAADLIHEWDYLVELFGFPKTARCIRGKYSRLEIDSDDAAVYIADYGGKVLELHLDYFGRIPRREIEIFTERGVITGDLVENIIFFTDGRPSIAYHEDPNDIYMNEMRFFLNLVATGQRFSNLEHCRAILAMALGGTGDFIWKNSGEYL